MREGESWMLHVDARPNKFNLKFRAKRFFFPNLYQISFNLRTHPRVSFLEKTKSLKSKFIKVLEKCRIFKHIKIGPKKNYSRSRCKGRNSGYLVKFYNWIAAEKDIMGTLIQSFNMFCKMKMFMGMNVIYAFLMILVTVMVSYWVLAIKSNNSISDAAGYLYKMLGDQLV